MKGKVCGDFCEFTLDKGHFITGEDNGKGRKRIDKAGFQTQGSQAGRERKGRWKISV